MRKLISFAFALAGFSATAFPADRHIAFERNKAVYIANLDGTYEKKIANGIFPAISPDGTRVAFAAVEKRSDTTLEKLTGGYTWVRCIAVAEMASGKNAVFRSIPARIRTTQRGRQMEIGCSLACGKTKPGTLA